MRGECCRCPLKVKVTGQRDDLLARVEGVEEPAFIYYGREINRYDYKKMKKHKYRNIVQLQCALSV